MMTTLTEWLARKPKGRAPRRRLRPVSAKRGVAARYYAAARLFFLARHPYCQVFIARMGLDEVALKQWGGHYADIHGLLRRAPTSDDVHHKAGRTGTNYLDEQTWLAVSRQEHEWIHAHPSEARKRGWLV
tara:strand:+ start:5583 stop:5972 length:390 start_codon:yes stop_codon:yes gene_type:complete